jgi:hypothetical protein
MRRALELAILVALLALVGCGGAKKKASTIVAANNACERAGITTGPRHEGVCVVNGVTITVANKAHWLQGKEYDARVTGLRTATTLRTPTGRPLRAHGKFVIVKLSVKNKLDAPHDFDRASDLVLLLVDHRRFSENHQAEHDPSLDSFALRGTPLQPDEVTAGTIVFDLPSEHAENVYATGSDLIFITFSDEGSVTAAAVSPPSRTIGYVRLWK